MAVNTGEVLLLYPAEIGTTEPLSLTEELNSYGIVDVPKFVILIYECGGDIAAALMDIGFELTPEAYRLIEELREKKMEWLKICVRVLRMLDKKIMTRARRRIAAERQEAQERRPDMSKVTFVRLETAQTQHHGTLEDAREGWRQIMDQPSARSWGVKLPTQLVKLVKECNGNIEAGLHKKGIQSKHFIQMVSRYYSVIRDHVEELDAELIRPEANLSPLEKIFHHILGDRANQIPPEYLYHMQGVGITDMAELLRYLRGFDGDFKAAFGALGFPVTKAVQHTIESFGAKGKGESWTHIWCEALLTITQEQGGRPLVFAGGPSDITDASVPPEEPLQESETETGAKSLSEGVIESPPQPIERQGMYFATVPGWERLIGFIGFQKYLGDIRSPKELDDLVRQYNGDWTAFLQARGIHPGTFSGPLKRFLKGRGHVFIDSAELQAKNQVPIVETAPSSISSKEIQVLSDASNILVTYEQPDDGRAEETVQESTEAAPSGEEPAAETKERSNNVSLSPRQQYKGGGRYSETAFNNLVAEWQKTKTMKSYELIGSPTAVELYGCILKNGGKLEGVVPALREMGLKGASPFINHIRDVFSRMCSFADRLGELDQTVTLFSPPVSPPAPAPSFPPEDIKPSVPAQDAVAPPVPEPTAPPSEPSVSSIDELATRITQATVTTTATLPRVETIRQFEALFSLAPFLESLTNWFGGGRDQLRQVESALTVLNPNWREESFGRSRPLELVRHILLFADSLGFLQDTKGQ